jgi:hypothetical protein
LAGDDSVGAETFSVDPSAAAAAVSELAVVVGDDGVFVLSPHAIAKAATAAKPRRNHFFCMHLLQVDDRGRQGEPPHHQDDTSIPGAEKA